MNFGETNLQNLQIPHQIDVNGTNGAVIGNVQIPLPTGRSAFGPELSLKYSSSSRNSTFGMGWSLSGIPFISIDTKKGLPAYDGNDDFAFNGGISLVPTLVQNGSEFIPQVNETSDYWIYYYREKIEDSFIRFEKWIRRDNGTMHWRTTTGDNIVSVYGARDGIIRDPKKKENIFIWLLEEQFDNQGNAIIYNYKEENSDSIDPRKSTEHKRIRVGNEVGFAQKYPDRIQYGNSIAILPDQPIPTGNKWLFEAVFDYGAYEARPYEINTPPTSQGWPVRQDPFSVYNPGFEVRTYRLCRRIISYNNIPELSSKPSLTGIFQIDYSEDPLGTTLKKTSYIGVRRDLRNGTNS